MFRAADFQAALALLLLALLVAAVLAWMAFSLGIMAVWDNQSSPPFSLVQGASGTWSATWEDRIGKFRERRLQLNPDEWRLDTEIQVRVEPRTAIAEDSLAYVDAEGWVTMCVPGRDQSVPSIDPSLVRHIDYRVVRVDPELAGSTMQLYVPGVIDSTYPGVAELLLLVALLFVLLGSLPLVLHLRAERRVRAESAADRNPGT